MLANWKCEDGAGNNLQDASVNANMCNVTGTLNWNSNQTETFTVFDYTETTRQPDNAVTALEWLCVPVQAEWNLDGKSWKPSCVPLNTTNSENEVGFYVQPNPANDIITIAFQKPVSEKTTMTLLSPQGSVLKQFTVQSGQNEAKISAAELTSGLYFLKMSFGNTSTTKKIIIY